MCEIKIGKPDVKLKLGKRPNDLFDTIKSKIKKDEYKTNNS